MTPFEEQLKQALARREPSKDFTAHVLARSRDHENGSRTYRGRRWLDRLRMWRLVPVLAAFLAMTGGVVYEQHERAIRGEQAKEQLLVAVRIAGSKLHSAQRQVIDFETREVKQ